MANVIGDLAYCSRGLYLTKISYRKCTSIIENMNMQTAVFNYTMYTKYTKCIFKHAVCDIIPG